MSSCKTSDTSTRNTTLGTNKSRRKREKKLLAAVKSGNLELARLFIQKGVDANSKDYIGKTCLFYATEKNYDDLARELLSAGAKCHCNEEYSPLMNSIANGNTELAKLLIEARTDPDIPISFKAVFMAVELKQTDLVKVLLDSGADDMSPYGETALYHAVESRIHDSNDKDHEDILRFFLSRDASEIYYALDPETDEQFNVIEALLANGTKSDIGIFLKYGLKLDNLGMELPLHFAARNRRDVLEYLIENTRLDIEENDPDECTVLHKAATYNSLNNVEILLHLGADFDAINFNGETPLLIAVENDCAECVEVLLDYGARVNHDPGDGRSAFYMAVKNDHLECLELLLTYGEHQLEITHRVFRDLIGSISRDTMKTLLRYVALLEFQGLYIDSKYYKLMIENEIEEDSTKKIDSNIKYLSDCKTELEILQTSIVYGSINFLEILTKNIPKHILSKECVVEILNSDSLLETFPIYGKQINDIFMKAKREWDMKEGAIQGLNKILPFNVESFYVAENICKHLYRRDLRNLSKV